MYGYLSQIDSDQGTYFTEHAVQIGPKRMMCHCILLCHVTLKHRGCSPPLSVIRGGAKMTRVMGPGGADLPLQLPTKHLFFCP